MPQERVGGVGGVGSAEELAFLGHAKLLDPNIVDALTMGGSIDGGLDVQCRLSDGLLIAGSLFMVGDGVAYAPDELETPELRAEIVDFSEARGDPLFVLSCLRY